MASPVTGRSFFAQKPESKEFKKEESKKQVTILAQAKIAETAPPPSLSEDQFAIYYGSSLSKDGRPIKDIEDDDIWSKNDPWLKELQKLQPLLKKKFPERIATCSYAKSDWTLPPD